MMWIVGSMAAGLLLSLSATCASFADWNRRFKAQSYYEFKNEYKVPAFMMIASGLGVIPVVGVIFGLCCWILFLSRADLDK